MDALAHEEGQLVCVLARSWHANDTLRWKKERHCYSEHPVSSSVLTTKAFESTAIPLSKVPLMTGIDIDYKNTHWPVIIDMTELVRQPLYVVWLQATAVIDDIVVCGGDTATSHSLAHDKEVIPGIRTKQTACEAHLSEGSWQDDKFLTLRRSVD